MDKKIGLINNISVYFVANILNAAIPFVLLPVLTRYLPPSEYGEIAMFQLLLAIFSSVIGFGAIGASVRNFYEDKKSEEEDGIFIGACFLVMIISGLLLVTLILMGEKKLIGLINLDRKWIFLTVITALLAFIVQMRLTQYQIRGKSISYGVIQVGQTLLIMILTLFLVIKFLEGGEGRLYGQLVSVAIFSAISLYYLYKEKLFQLKFDCKQIKKVLKFGLPTIPHELGIIFLAFADRYYINEKLGLFELGIYMVAIQLAAIMSITASSINNAYVPWLFERLKRNIYSEKIKIVKITYIYFFIAIFISIISFFIAQDLINIIVGKDYSSASDVIAWLFLSQGFAGMYLMITNYIFYTGKTTVLAIITPISCVAYIILLSYLVPQYGVKGAAIASAILMLLRFLIVWYFANRCFQMPWLYFIKTKI